MGLYKKQIPENRFKGIKRDYSKKEVLALRGNNYDFAVDGSIKLWNLLNSEPYIFTFGCLNGSQAIQMAELGLKAIYVSGWQVAADANLSNNMYPDLSLYPYNSVPSLVEKINNILKKKEQIENIQIYNGEKKQKKDWFLPIIADAEAGFGGLLNTYELTLHLIKAGASGIHLEDQLASEKKCGHLGGKVLIPTSQFIKKLKSARLAADVYGSPTVIIARTDSYSAKLITNNVDKKDLKYIDESKPKTEEGFYHYKGGIEAAIQRSLSYANFADLLWFETPHPNLDDAKKFSDAIHYYYPDKLLAYNCSPSFNWKKYLNDSEIKSFQESLAKMGYKFQFITLAGFHLINYHTFNFVKDYINSGMEAYVNLQQKEFQEQQNGFNAVKHQSFVGTNYYDFIKKVLLNNSSTLALNESTEKDQF